MTDELQTDNYPREQYQTQAPIGATSAGLAASIALGRLLRMAPHADIASIRFEITDQGEGAYAGPGPYVICSAAEPDECPSCHTIAGQHPHTEYCRRTAELQHRADLWPGTTSLDDVITADLDAPGVDCPSCFRLRKASPGRGCSTPEAHTAPPFGQTSQPATRTSQPPTQHRSETGPELVINIHGEASPNLVDEVSKAIRAAHRRDGRRH